MGSTCSTPWPLNSCLCSRSPSSRHNSKSDGDADESPSSTASSTSHSEQKQRPPLLAKNKMSKPAMIPAAVKQTASFIFLHGLGDAGTSWLQAFNMYGIPNNLRHVKFIFPNAPIQRVTLNMGMQMPSWFDIHGLEQNAMEDTAGIEKSSKLLNDLVEQEIQSGIDPAHVMIGGFSMGGAVALHAALTSAHTLGGIVALSTWLPLATSFPKALIDGDKKVNLPILQCHGTQDPLVQLKWAKLTADALHKMGFKQYQFKEYAGLDHSSNDKEMQDVRSFIVQHLSNNS